MECPVCLDIYDIPLLLPGCGHTLCKTCAERLVKNNNYLRCPECRLVYQLRQGIKSLPKNLALQRTIEMNLSSTVKLCDEHPIEVVALYCKTCEKSICLKCYFESNTLRKGQSAHVGHDVDTTDDAFVKEKKMLEKKKKVYTDKCEEEKEYIASLANVKDDLETIMNDKIKEITDNREELIRKVKLTSNKLLFTLKGSATRDQEQLKETLECAEQRFTAKCTAANVVSETLAKTGFEHPDVDVLKEARKRASLAVLAVESLDETKPTPESFLKITDFDTSIDVCLDDISKALSYQTDIPTCPSIDKDGCIISHSTALITAQYDTKIRVKSITLYYKEALYKGLCEKPWDSVDMENVNKGLATHILRSLTPGCSYKVYVVASNVFGDSQPSKELWFKTFSEDIELKIM